MKEISTTQAPAAIGPYSQAIVTDRLVFVSGQVPIDPATGKVVVGDIRAEARQSLTNVAAVLGAAGCSTSDVVKTTVYLTDMGDFAAVNEVYESFFSRPYPARSAVAVKALPKGARVEVECIAERVG